MARQTWMDRTIEATREAEIVMPWFRRPSQAHIPEQPGEPASAQAR